ncbi:MAG: thioredoxin family protein [Bacteroidales bacterium]
MKRLILFLNLLFAGYFVTAQGYKVGDAAAHFNLKNVDGKMVSSESFKNAKGFIVIFTCNECPYAKAYVDRINEMDKKYKSKGFPVIAINPNDPAVQPADSYDNMVKTAKEKNFSFPYLFDPDRKISALYGATNTPHVYLLSLSNNKLTVEYIGAIDDNSSDASKVTKPYLANAIDALLSGQKPSVSYTKAIGCGVKKRA